MPTYYRGGRYTFYRNPRRSVKRVRTISDRTFWISVGVLVSLVIAALAFIYSYFIG